MLAWQAFKGISGQLRMYPEVVGEAGKVRTGAHACGLDYTACFAYATAIGAANSIFFELLPEIEVLIVHSYAQGYANV